MPLSSVDVTENVTLAPVELPSKDVTFVGQVSLGTVVSKTTMPKVHVLVLLTLSVVEQVTLVYDLPPTTDVPTSGTQSPELSEHDNELIPEPSTEVVDQDGVALGAFPEVGVSNIRIVGEYAVNTPGHDIVGGTASKTLITNAQLLERRALSNVMH